MKLIIAGSRNLYPSFELIDKLIRYFLSYDDIHEIVSGGASGIDRAGELWQEHCKRKYDLYSPDIKIFKADWKTHKKAAGPIRNKQMAEYADALLLIWDGKSKGSANIKKEMKKLNKPIYEVILHKV